MNARTVGNVVVGMLLGMALSAKPGGAVVNWWRTVPEAACSRRYESTVAGAGGNLGREMGEGGLNARLSGYWCPFISDIGAPGAPAGATVAAIYVDYWSSVEGTAAAGYVQSCWSAWNGAMTCSSATSLWCASHTTGCETQAPAFPSVVANPWNYYSVYVSQTNDYFIMKGVGFSGQS